MDGRKTKLGEVSEHLLRTAWILVILAFEVLVEPSSQAIAASIITLFSVDILCRVLISDSVWATPSKGKSYVVLCILEFAIFVMYLSVAPLLLRSSAFTEAALLASAFYSFNAFVLGKR